MFRLTIKEKCISYELDNANEVANAVFNNTNEWMFASHVRNVCSKAKSGDRFEYEDDGIIIECI